MSGPEGWLRWRLRQLLGRNALVRPSDRFEAVLLLLVAVASAVMIAVAGAIGTATHEARLLDYQHQAQTVHPVAATVLWTEGAASSVDGAPLIGARWSANGVAHTATFNWDHPVAVGDDIRIWVDRTGHRAGAPDPAGRAATDAVAAAVVAWGVVTGGGTALFVSVRYLLDRRRRATWDREAFGLTGNGGGLTDRHR
jgi:hypothetical protein